MVQQLMHSLDKPWNKQPKMAPGSPAVFGDDPSSLPSTLLDAVKDTPKQDSLTDYTDVHKWWWIVFEQLLLEMKKSDTDELNTMVTR
jgi:hypothetical protein